MKDEGWRMEDGGWRMEDGGWRMKDDDFILLRVLVTDRLSNRQTFVNVELLLQLKKKCQFSQWEGGP